jgi:hypothetical protein
VPRYALVVVLGAAVAFLSLGLLALHHNTPSTVIASDVSEVRAATAHVDTSPYAPDVNAVRTDVVNAYGDLRTTLQAPRGGVCAASVHVIGDHSAAEADVASLHGDTTLATSLSYLDRTVEQLRSDDLRINRGGPTGNAIAEANAAAARARAVQTKAFAAAAVYEARAARFASLADAACRRSAR